MTTRLLRRWALPVLLGTAGLGASAMTLAATTTATATAAAPAQGVSLQAAALVPQGAKALSALPGATELHLTLTLRPRNAAALSRFATAVSTPGSSEYRRYLTVSAFASRFGANASELALVRSTLEADGLKPTAPTANHLSIGVTGTASEVSRAFSTSLERYRLSSGSVVYLDTAAPRVTSALSHALQGVFGLDDLPAARPLGLVRPLSRSTSTSTSSGRATRTSRTRPHAVPAGAASPCSDASTEASDDSGYTTNQFATAYDYNPLYSAGDLGSGITVALYELEGNIASDIGTFESCYGIGTSAASNVSYVEVDGGQTSPTDTEAQAEEEGLETDLDIENVVGLAPKVHALVYQAPNTDAGAMDNYEAIASQDKAKVISSSWGDCESAEGASTLQSEETVFEEAAAQGQSMTAAAGDDGSEDCEGESLGEGPVSTGLPGPNPSLAVDDPGSDPYVTSAGGTSLTAIGNPPATRPTETVWNDGPVEDLADEGGGGGGGDSSYWGMPLYQSKAASSLKVINGNSSDTCGAAGSAAGTSGSDPCREVPDVTSSADPDYAYVVYWAGSWTVVGGTSGSAPLWASIFALTDGDSACDGQAIGFANPVLYAAAGSDYAAYFNDITKGNNDAYGFHDGLYPATTGYDQASGLGSPVSAALAPALCDAAFSFPNPGPRSTTVRTKTSLKLTASDAAVATSGNTKFTLTYSASGLPPGLKLDTTTGEISGKPTKAGSYAVTVGAKDAQGHSATDHFTWKIIGRPSLTKYAVSGVAAKRPRVTFRLGAGEFASEIKSFTVRLPYGIALHRHGAAVAKGVTLTTASGARLRFTAKTSTGRIEITLRKPASAVLVTLAEPGIQDLGHVGAKSRSRSIVVTVLSVRKVRTLLRARTSTH